MFISGFKIYEFLSCGTEYVKLLLKSIENKFWFDVFKAWVELQNAFSESDVTADSPLFYNPMIHIGGKTFFNNQLFVNNIRYVNDIIEEDGSFLTYDTFCDTYQDVRFNFLEYAGIIHAVKSWQKSVVKTTN